MSDLPADFSFWYSSTCASGFALSAQQIFHLTGVIVSI
jgi:hypothetical protein